MKSVFEFIDFRKYLEHYYAQCKRRYSYFSYRYFSNKAGIGSPSIA